MSADASVGTRHAGLDQLLDKQAIYEVLMRYCRGVDRCDETLIRSVYHDDAFDEHGPYRALGSEFARNIVEAKLRETRWTMHAVHNVLIETHGEEAFSEAVFVSYQQMVDDDRLQVFAGRYVDRFARRQGEWRIAHRVVVHDWSGSTELAPWSMGSIPPARFTQGTRGDDDEVMRAGRQFRLDR